MIGCVIKIIHDARTNIRLEFPAYEAAPGGITAKKPRTIPMAS